MAETKKRESPYPADYKGASPRQVAEALLRYRPGKSPRKPTQKPEEKRDAA